VFDVHSYICGVVRLELASTVTGGGGGSSMSTHELTICNNCGVGGVSLFKCGKCRKVQYCGAKCQKEHWRTHKPLCGDMVQPGGTTAYTFSHKHVSDAVDLHNAQLRRELHILDPEGLRAHDLELAAAMERMNIVPEDEEVRMEVAKCVAKSCAARRMGETYNAARCMFDAALVYLRAQWFLDGRKALERCKKLLTAHVAKHGSHTLSDDLSGYTELYHAVYTNAAKVEDRLDPIKNRERREGAARKELSDAMHLARAMPPGHERACRMRLLIANIKTERATLTETQSWEGVIDLQMELIFLECEIATFEGTMEDPAVVVCIDDYVSVGESILLAHKNSFDPGRYAAHLEVFRELRSDVECLYIQGTLPRGLQEK